METSKNEGLKSTGNLAAVDIEKNKGEIKESAENESCKTAEL